MRNLAIFLIKGYKKFVSPLFGAKCRFEPTCSQYAIDAYTNKKFLKATFLVIFRILRCNPFCKGGYDPLK